jgi:hypothetical protein
MGSEMWVKWSGAREAGCYVIYSMVFSDSEQAVRWRFSFSQAGRGLSAGAQNV